MTQTQTRQPSLQNEVIDEILHSIGQADLIYIDSLIEDLIEKNQPHSHSTDGFLFGGTFFTTLAPKAARLVPKLPLHRSLYDQGQELVDASKELARDIQRLKQGLTVVLRDCETDQDIRDALPNSVRMVLPGLASFERTRPVAYTIMDKPLLFDQYAETERLLQYYLSSRMLQ